MRDNAVILALALAWTVFSAWWLMAAGSTQHVACARLEPAIIECEAQVRWLGLVPLGAAERLARVVSATTETVCVGEECTTTVTLVGRAASLPLRWRLFEAASGEATRDRVRSFVDSAEKTLQLDLVNWPALLLGVPSALTVGLGGGLWFVYHAGEDLIAGLRAARRRASQK